MATKLSINYEINEEKTKKHSPLKEALVYKRRLIALQETVFGDAIDKILEGKRPSFATPLIISELHGGQKPCDKKRHDC